MTPSKPRVVLLASGVTVLALLWLGPLREMAHHSFAAHMTIHMTVVAVAAPLLASGLAASRFDPVRLAPWLFAAIPASMIEFLVVSAWHAPFLHQAARGHAAIFAVEQATFLASGLLLWLAAVGGSGTAQPWRPGAGVGALLFTSMHMTLLGALFALTPRALYPHPAAGSGGMPALDDQHLGGAIMLLLGGASYLAGGLWLTARMLRARVRPGADTS
jgi:putative membrane protein